MSHEARCPHCGSEFEISAEDIAAIVAEAAKASGADGPKSTRFAFRPQLVEQDGVQVLQIVPVPPAKGRPTSER